MSRYRPVAGIALAVLFLDQLTKWWIRRTVALYESIPVVDSFFHITHVSNTGGAFSFLSGSAEAFRLPFFIGVSLVAIAVLVAFVRRVPDNERVLLWGLAAILGGAAGNLVDRVVAGKVTDFLDFQIRGYHWPAFNVADTGITVGMAILLAHTFFVREEPAADE